MRGANDVAPLGERLQHERAYEAYPDLRNIQSEIEMGEGAGGGSYGIAQPGGEEAIWASGSDPRSLRKTGLHELQHAIQAREGFARGGSPAGMMPDAIAARRIWQDEIVPKASETLIKEYENYQAWMADKQWTNAAEHEALQAAYAAEFPDLVAAKREALDIVSAPQPTSNDLYKRLAGEVEARNVAKRSDYLPEIARKWGPEHSQDVPTAEQIVRFRPPSGEAEMSLGKRLQGLEDYTAQLPQLGSAEAVPGRISTRLSSAEAKDPTHTLSLTGQDVMAGAPGSRKPYSNLDLLRDYPGLRHVRDAPPEQVFSEDPSWAVSTGKTCMSAWRRRRAMRPCNGMTGAHDIADAWSENYGVPHSSVSGTIAALSPQKDWFQNASLAQRVMEDRAAQGRPGLVGRHDQFPELECHRGRRARPTSKRRRSSWAAPGR